jgi:hypothetical protein
MTTHLSPIGPREHIMRATVCSACLRIVYLPAGHDCQVLRDHERMPVAR